MQPHGDQAASLPKVCPQHDVIWSELTVREHLEFFAKAWHGSKGRH